MIKVCIQKPNRSVTSFKNNILFVNNQILIESIFNQFFILFSLISFEIKFIINGWLIDDWGEQRFIMIKESLLNNIIVSWKKSVIIKIYLTEFVSIFVKKIKLEEVWYAVHSLFHKVKNTLLHESNALQKRFLFFK
jgi:hypothetical protein